MGLWSLPAYRATGANALRAHVLAQAARPTVAALRVPLVVEVNAGANLGAVLDVRQILNIRDLAPFQRFVRMCAARVSQLLDLSSLGADCGVTHHTPQAWISALEASYLVFLLRPYHVSLGKRLIKTPK